MPETDEGVIHTVTSLPVPEQQALPGGTHVWEISWSRRQAMMRIRRIHCPHDACYADPYEWWFKKSAGRPYVLGANDESGRMLFLAKASIQHRGGHPFLQFYRPDRKELDLTYGELQFCHE